MTEVGEVRRCYAADAAGTEKKAAAENFLWFCKMVRPGLLKNEFVESLAVHLADFYHELIAGKRPKLALFTPPQHGKSWAVKDFVAWASGRAPWLKTYYASYSDELARSQLCRPEEALGPPVDPLALPDMLVGGCGIVVPSERQSGSHP